MRLLNVVTAFLGKWAAAIHQVSRTAALHNAPPAFEEVAAATAAAASDTKEVEIEPDE